MKVGSVKCGNEKVGEVKSGKGKCGKVKVGYGWNLKMGWMCVIWGNGMSFVCL